MRVPLSHECAQPGAQRWRSTGTRIGTHIGIIASGETGRHELAPEDWFIILASDGVWDVMSDDDAQQLSAVALSRDCCCAYYCINGCCLLLAVLCVLPSASRLLLTPAH